MPLRVLADAGAEDSGRPSVSELSTENFDAHVQNGTVAPWFVKFYAPWCGHCQRLAPKWAELAERLKGRVQLAKVDATVEKELAERWAVEGYPTLILITDGSGYVYEGARSLEALESFALGGYAQGPGSPAEPEDEDDEAASSVRLTHLTIDAAVRARGSRPWFINFHIPSCGHCKNLAPSWEELARDLKGSVNVAKVNALRERALAEHWGVGRFPTLRLVVGDSVYDYEGEREVAAMCDFALGGYASSRAAVLPEPVVPLELTLMDGLLARQHMIVAFVGGVGFAGLVSMVWVRLTRGVAENVEAAGGDKKAQ
uniref:Thioredoxin domain-containing protein n=1 Tax=Alexandrium andersonii TaxID=327968 RepID=A0A7S2AJF1_9DINO